MKPKFNPSEYINPNLNVDSFKGVNVADYTIQTLNELLQVWYQNTKLPFGCSGGGLEGPAHICFIADKNGEPRYYCKECGEKAPVKGYEIETLVNLKNKLAKSK